MPKVSVIIPTFNRAELISESITSVINQTYSDWELLIVDDFSTDNTENVVNNIVLKHCNTKIYYMKNKNKKGVSGARNTGMRHASGEYIALLDSDDLWHKDNLKEKIEIFSSDTSICALLSDSYFFSAAGNSHVPWPYMKEIFDGKYWDRQDALLSIARSPIIIFMARNGVPFRMPSVVFKKDILVKTGFFNEDMIYFEDVDFIFRCFCIGKIGYLHKKLCYIRRHPSNTSNIYGENIREDSHLLFVKSRIEHALKFNPSFNKAILRKVSRDAYIRRATSWFKEGGLDEARKCILQSMRIEFCIKAFMRLLGIYGLSFFPSNVRDIMLKHFRPPTLG